MSSTVRFTARCVLLAALRVGVSLAQTPATPALEPMPRTLEMALALSAAPPHLHYMFYAPKCH